jgi:hypothetical protein
MKKKYKLNSKVYKKNKSRYIKISKNQLRILDSLLNDGGKTKKYFDNKKNLKYSEHSGLLDFGKSTLQRILINTKKSLSDLNDDQILLPDNIPDAFDYEYFFHTHPPTPNPLSRIKNNILYDMPSVNDIYHFIDHYNDGKTQGSIVISSEGIYIIKVIYDKKIKLKNIDKIYNYYEKKIFNIQLLAIEKYKKELNLKNYYKKIIQDKTFIKEFNKILKKINIVIKYYPREKVKNKWILNDIYLKVNPIE